ncbi:unnamed protein product [Sphagnum jensenii]|uniref:Uncharacterized protein n=1 Tax=Sphagnum jensenii TaxID=128206 RepID=A0ABP1BIL5_9BRYO
MKAPIDAKVDGSKQQQQQQAGPALFPRLHVAETKRMGPRAPPRNKMALYEQFTIPVKRFSSSPVSPLSATQNAFNNPPMSPALVPGFPPQRYSCGWDTELQCVPLVAGSSVPMPGPKSSKKGKLDDDFAVPTYSTATQGSSQKRSTSSGPQSQEAASREHRPTWRHWDSGKQKRFNTEAPGGSDQPQVHKAVTNSDDVSSEQTGCLSEQTGIVSEQNGGLSEQNCGLTWHTSSVTASVDDRDVSKRVIDQTDADLDVSLQESDMLERDRDAAEQLQPSLTSPCSRAEEAERLRGQSEQNRYSSGNSENVSGEVSEQVGRGCSGNESESSMLDYVPVEKTTPLDVMSAIGQQEFCRVRKTILRQQKMFSVQVYELHRLMEVQRQLAMCPDLTLEANDDVVEEQEQKQEDQQQVPESAPVTPLQPHVPELPAKCIEDNGMKKCKNNQPVIMERPQLKYPLLLPHQQQSFLPGQRWQAAPFAANEWGAQMGPPYMYFPYPPPYPPAYGFHPLMHPDMVMCEQNGGMRYAQLPPWQQPTFPHDSGALGPAPAWYTAPCVPAMESAQQRVTVGLPHHGHPPVQVESVGGSSQMHGFIPYGTQCSGQSHKPTQNRDDGWAKGSPQGGAIKAVPQAALVTPELTAEILLSIQQERQQL